MTEPYTLHELIAEYRHIGCPAADVAAPRLGLSPAHLEKCLHRARRLGLLPASRFDRLQHQRAAS